MLLCQMSMNYETQTTFCLFDQCEHSVRHKELCYVTAPEKGMSFSFVKGNSCYDML